MSTTILSLMIPFVLERASNTPAGFDPNSLLAPYLLEVSYREEPQENKNATLWLDGNVAWSRTSVLPALGVGGGPALYLGPVYLEPGLEIQEQKTLGGPLDGTQFDTILWSAVLRTRVSPISYLSFGLDGRYMLQSDSTIASFEALETKVGHDDTFIVSPWLTIHLPSGPLEKLDLRGRMDFFSVGSTAIASQEFAFTIPRLNSLRRFNAGVSVGFDKLTVSADFYWVAGQGDPIELAYQAPWLTRDYVLSPRTLTAEVSWKF